MKLRSVILLKPKLQIDSQDEADESRARDRGLPGSRDEDQRRLGSSVHRSTYDEVLDDRLRLQADEGRDLRVVVQNVRDDVRRGDRSLPASSRYNVYPNGKYGPPVHTRHRLVVENLSSRVRWPDLKDFMRQAGDVTFAGAHQVRSNEGVVHFATRFGLLNAMEELDGTQLDGMTIRLVEDRLCSRRPRSRERINSRDRIQRTNYRLTVENLSERVNWHDLKDHMRTAGEVQFADVFKNRRNEGFVEFATFSDMMNAIEQLDDTELDGRRIRLVEDRRNSLSYRSPINQFRSNSRSSGFYPLESPKLTKPRQFVENLSSTASAYKNQRENSIQALPIGSPTKKHLDEFDDEDLNESNMILLEDLDGSIISESSSSTNRSRTGMCQTEDTSGPALKEDMEITPTRSDIETLQDCSSSEGSAKLAEDRSSSPISRYSRFRSSSRSRSPRETK